MPIDRYERALYGTVAILAVIMFATLSIATYATSIEAHIFFLSSFVALVGMAFSLVAFKIVKTVMLSRNKAETTNIEEIAEDDESLS